MNLVRLIIRRISYSQTQSGAYTIILNEINGDRNLPIIIGVFEAQSIAIALEKTLKSPRPLTHDLFKNFADVFGITIKEIIIHKLIDGVFYSSIICEKDGIVETIDARTSDAIALAVRFGSPIFTYKNILDKAGVFLNLDENILNIIPKEKEEQDFVQEMDLALAKLSIEELRDLLQKFIFQEDYENAAKIRDEISKRK